MNNNDDNKRIETVICNKDCEILYLNKEMYNEYIKKISEKLRREKLKYLLEIYLLKTQNKNNFIKNYSGYFVKKIFKYNEYIYTENKYVNNINININNNNQNDNNFFENNHYIYFIVKGNFETKCKKSLNEIDMILGKNNNDNNELKKLKEYYEHRIFKLLKFSDDDVIGLGDCIYNNRYIFDLICVSSEAVVYEINFMFFKALFNSDKIIKAKVKKIQNKKIDILIKSLEKIRESRINLIKDKYSQFHFDEFEINKNNNINNNNNLFHSQKNNKTKAKIKINNNLLPNIIKKNNNNSDNNNENNNKNYFSVGNSLNKIDFNNNNNNNHEKRQLTDSNIIIIKDNKENNNNNFDMKFRHKIFEENRKYFNVDINSYNKKKNIILNYNNINLNKDYYNPLIYDDFNKRFNTLTYLNFNSLSSRNSSNKNKIYKIRLTETPEIKTHKKIKDNLNNNNNNKNNYKIINIKLKNIYNKKYKKLFKTLKNY